MVRVYFANIENVHCDEAMIQSLNSVRLDYIKSISNSDRRKQSFWVWKLLEFGLKDVFGRSDFEFNFNGKFFSVKRKPNVNFSLAHSKNIVAVAISEKSVGVDVEACDEKVLKLKNYIDVNNENKLNEQTLIDKYTLGWTKKESLFKAKSGKNYQYIKITDKKYEYFLTVCSDEENAEFTEVNLKNK